jgi:protein-glutamine gamma-glutamyltransferase
VSAIADHAAGIARRLPREEPHGPQLDAARPTGPASAPGWARLVAFVPLALLGAVGWTKLVAPAPHGAAWAMVATATAAGAVLVSAPADERRVLRTLRCALVVVALAAAALLAAGVRLRLLWPLHWGELANDLGAGLTSMGGVAVPYRGFDPWVRVALLLSGTVLVALAAPLAFWPRRHGPLGRHFPAAVALGALYAVPVIEVGPRHPYLGGLVFSILLGAFLWLERLRTDQIGIGFGCLVGAAVIGVVLAPRLDARKPWINYEHLADSLTTRASEQFSWDHRYTPLKWPRDGREVLRIKAQVPTYWKAVTLDEFDGIGWRHSPDDQPSGYDGEIDRSHPEWFETITVLVRNLKSHQFIGAGNTREVLDAPPLVPDSPGTFVTQGAPLVRGASYRARVYVPRPTQTQLGDDGTAYPTPIQDYLDIDLPPAAGGPPAPADNPLVVRFPVYGSGGHADTLRPDGTVGDNGISLVRRSAYGRVYELAQRLRSQSTSPYDFVRRVERRVEDGASYSEAPPQHPLPLVPFLFGDRTGYCQHFSGAMALLLRMGGVPARVASGFAPGSLDRSTGEWVVRDLDAHSWVEAYFPYYGWVQFDPTPAIAPPRSQASDDNLPSAARGDVRDQGGIGERAKTPRAGAAVTADHTPPWGLIGGGAALLVLLAVGALVVVRRGRVPGGALAPELAELQRALHRTARTPPLGMTLARLETILGGSDSAAAYVRTVRDRRFAPRANGGPTREQRRALRRELAAGLGFSGRLRAWWALPPQPKGVLRRRRGRYPA